MIEQKQADVKSTTNVKDPMVDYVVKEFQRYEDAHRTRFEDCQQIYDYWMNKPPRREYDWLNAVHVPMMIEAEQTITPRIYSAVFPVEAPLEVITFDPFTPEQGIKIRDTIKHYFTISNVAGESLPAMGQMTLFGTGYVESPWLIERKWQIGQTGERYQAVTANRPDCKTVNFFEMFPHPAKLRMDDGLPLIRRRFCDAEYLKKLADDPRLQFKNLKEALDSKSTMSSPTSILDSNGNAMRLEDKEKYEMLQYWGPWDSSYEKDGKVVTKKAVPYWIIVINRTVLVRAIPNPYNHQRPPYCKMTLFDDPNPNWFGVGIGQVGKPTQERLNKIVNQRLDNVDLVLNKQGFYNGNDPLINLRKLQVSKPGQWHKVSDTIASIRWMETPDVTQSSYKEEEIAKNDFRESTGATVPLMPTDEGQHRTAMGINLLQGAAGMRFKPILNKLEKDLIQDLAMIYLSNLQQFMVLPELISVTDDTGSKSIQEIRPEDLQAKVLFTPTGVSEMMNKEMQVGQLLRFKELTVQDPTVNRAEINKRLAELMGFKDIGKLLTPPQPMTMKPGGLSPQEQQMIQQRLGEGASPEQIKQEMLGVPPAPVEEGAVA
jgi:hypothetical protein